MRAKAVIIFDTGHNLTSQSKEILPNYLTETTYLCNVYGLNLCLRYSSDIFMGGKTLPNRHAYILIHLKSSRRRRLRAFALNGDSSVGTDLSR